MVITPSPLIPCSVAASRLRQASVAVRFVTNTTKECKRALVERLQQLRFNVQVQRPSNQTAELQAGLAGRSCRGCSLD